MGIGVSWSAGQGWACLVAHVRTRRCRGSPLKCKLEGTRPGIINAEALKVGLWHRAARTCMRAALARLIGLTSQCGACLR